MIEIFSFERGRSSASSVTEWTVRKRSENKTLSLISNTKTNTSDKMILFSIQLRGESKAAS